MFHRYISSETLKAYLAGSEVVANQVRRKIHPADIPVIVKVSIDIMLSPALDPNYFEKLQSKILVIIQYE